MYSSQRVSLEGDRDGMHEFAQEVHHCRELERIEIRREKSPQTLDKAQIVVDELNIKGRETIYSSLIHHTTFSGL